ncbi:MAG: cytidine deaminase [Oscillospiraceae bacterium]|nr:cytidine deaminase [Oscillospiraceae bacterium]
MMRIDKENYYLDIAETVAERSTCLRRCYGAILVRHDEIISTGYNGAPRGRANCTELNYCTREAMKIPSGERYELCRSVHAEQNCIISAARRDMLGATLYMVCRDPASGGVLPDTTSCALCRRLIINAGIARVVIRDTKMLYRVVDVQKWIDEDDSLPDTAQ